MEKDDAEMAWAKQVHERLVVVESRAIATNAIMMEVVRLLARSSADPQRLLSGLFESVSGRLDQGPIEDEAKPVVSEARDAIARFFAKAGYGLDRSPDR
jgi:hypothetical protein